MQSISLPISEIVDKTVEEEGVLNAAAAELGLRGVSITFKLFIWEPLISSTTISPMGRTERLELESLT